MKRTFTAFAACALLSVSAMAQNALPKFMQTQTKKMDKAAVVERKHYDNGAEVLIRETEDGYRFKQLAPMSRGEKVGKTLPKRAQGTNGTAGPMKAREDMTWAESFEGWDGKDFMWLPDGWERHSNGFDGTHQTWFVNYMNNIYCPQPVDGQYYMEILFTSQQRQNEWIDSPYQTVREGDKFSCYVMTAPFFLFDESKWDTKNNVFTERVNVFNFRVYVQAEGDAKWTEIYNMWNEYKDWSVEDLQALTEETGSYTVIRVLEDMSQYVGKKVHFRFHYSGKDGNSVFLDHIELGKPYLTADYYQPTGTFNLGMTQNFEIPVDWSYFPDGETLTWYNLSSDEATTTKWTYTDPETGNRVNSYDTDLKVTYGFTPEQEGNPDNLNVYEAPVLEVSADGFQSATYQAIPTHFKIGGRTDVTVDGKQYLCGGSTYNTAKGMTIATANGTPLCGHEEDVDPDFWYDINGLSKDDYEVSVVGIYNAFETPRKAYKVRGLWVHGIGEIGKNAKITATIHRIEEDGALSEVPLASAKLNPAKIIHNGSASGAIGKDYDYITLPFDFADPIEIDEAVFVRINGFTDGDVKYFAPLQSRIPDTYCHGFVRLSATARATGQHVNTGMLPISDISNEYGECFSSFYVTMEMAYGDHEDWGHRNVNEDDRPALELENGLIQNHPWGEELYNRPCRSAFYDTETEFPNIVLYLCVGQLEAGEDPHLTNHIAITTNPFDMDEELDLSESITEVKFYDITSEQYVYTATDGKLFVTETETGYDVELTAYDSKHETSFGVIYKDKPWIDFSIKNTTPNQYAVGSEGDDVHEITRVVINHSDEENCYIAVYSDEAEPVTIKTTYMYMDGRFHGFSAVNSDAIVIGFRGNKYSYSNTTVPNLDNTSEQTLGAGLGGNICVTYAEDGEDNYMTLDFNLYSAVAEGGHNVVGHFAGECQVDEANGVITISPLRKNDAKRYSLTGQPVSKDFRGVVVVDGKKVIQ